MNFLAPLFLLGGAAILGPLIYHLIRRSTRERTAFSSLMFLQPSPPRISKRHRLQHILLLILRCAALLLLALGFARPFFREAALDDPTAALPKRAVVLVDTSASMRREGAWAAARQRVETILRAAAPTDQVALYAFDRRPEALVTFDEWNRTPPGDRAALAAGRLAGVSPGWGGTQLGAALIAAAETLAETDARHDTGGAREIVLVSDLQAGSRLDSLQAYEWPNGIALRVEPVKPRTTTNAGLQLVAEAADASRAAAPVVRVRVSNSGDATREQFQVGWARGATGADISGVPIEVYVPPGQSRVVTVPVPQDAPPGERIVLRGDDDPFDNAVYAIPPVQQRVDVLWLGAERENDERQPLFFLRRALMDTPRLDLRVTSRAPAATGADGALRDADLVFVSEALPAEAGRAVRAAATAGRTVVVVPKSAGMAATLGAILGRDDVRLDPVRPESYAMFAEIDFQHPVFAPFRDPRFSDFTKIHVWNYRRLDAATIPEARVIARFDSGDPALTEIPLGRGRVFVWAMGWHPEDSQLAVSSKFVPLMWSLLETSGGAATAPTQHFAGDRVALPAGGDGQGLSVRTPAGTNVTVAGADGAAAEFAETEQPGVYQILGGEEPQRFAVNLDAAESRTAPLSLDDLEQMGVPVAAARASPEETRAERAQLAAVEAENRQKLWRWLIVATLIVLLVESALAGWSARRGEMAVGLKAEGLKT